MKKLALLCVSLPCLASAKLVTKEVPYEHNGVQLQGYLAYDDEKVSPGKTPGILVIHEWWGLNAYAKSRAEDIAKLGYVAFAADMYGTGITTEDAQKAGELAKPFYGTPLMAGRARAGLDELAKIPSVDPTKLGAIGFCFGGSTIQALAYSGAPLLGIASFHGNPVSAPESTATPIKTHFLLMNGAIDPMVSSEAKANLQTSLEKAKIDYQSIDYSGALHAFTNPNADAIAAKTGLTGKVGYNAMAAERSWEQMKRFFSELFSDKK